MRRLRRRLAAPCSRALRALPRRQKPEDAMTPEPVFDEVNRIANDASDVIGDAIIDFAERVPADVLDAGEVFFATVSGAMTGALKVLSAAGRAGAIQNPDGKVDALLRQAADIWGQINGDRAAGSTIQ
jgi:hypothetical protein